MGVLDSLTPQQQTALKFGVPAVAAFALISTWQKKNQPADGDAAAGTPSGVLTGGFAMPSTDAIGTGQLADFESTITQRINDLGVGFEEVRLSIPTSYAPTPAPASEDRATFPAPPAPAPAACPPPPAPGIAGEVIIGHLDAPGGGCWYFTNFGGVFNMGGAPFKGSAVPYRMGPGYENPPRYVVSYEPLGAGYRLTSNRGEHYDFP